MKSDLLNRIPPRARKYLKWFGIVFVLYSLLGFLVLPFVIKWQMVKRLPEITKRQAAVRQVKVNPWTLSLTIRGLALQEPTGERFAAWEEFYVNFQSSSLFRWAWTFKEIRLVEPFGEIILFKNGQPNFANMFDTGTNAPPAPSGPSSIPRINIYSLDVTNGFVAMEDRTRRSVFRTEYRPINLHLTEFTTRPNNDTPYSFRAESDAGRSVAWSGDFSVNPLRSAGHLELTGIRLSRYQPYLEDFTRAVLTNGLADVKMNYRLEAGTNGFEAAISNGIVRVEQVHVIDPDTQEPVARLQGLDISGAEFSLLQHSARLKKVTISEASLLARLKADGQINLLGLLATPEGTNSSSQQPSAPAPATPEKPYTLAVDETVIEKTSLTFEDLSRRTPFKTVVQPIEVTLRNFTTAADSDAEYSFQLATEAEETVEGAGSFSINPVRSRGDVKIAGVQVNKYLPYFEDMFRGKIVSGKIRAQVPYRAAMGTKGLTAGVTNLTFALSGLEVLMPENSEQVTRIEEIAFEDVEASLEDHYGRVGRFTGNGGFILVRRDKNGNVNLLGLLPEPKTNAVTADAAAPEQTPSTSVNWVFKLDELALSNYRFKIEDHVPTNAATVVLDNVSLNVKGASTVSNTPVQASFSARVNESGTFAMSGTANMAPLTADFEVGVTNLDLRMAQPYIDPFVRLGIVSGALNTAGRVLYQTNDPASAMLTFTGDVGISNLVTADQVHFKEFLRWDNVAVRGIEAALQPNRVKIREIHLRQPRASLAIGADRTPNLSLILPGSTETNAVAATAAGTETAGAKSPAFPIELGTLVLEDAAFAFVDESVQPKAAITVQDIDGTVKGLSSALNSTAEVDIHGRVDQQSTFSVAGRVNPLAEELFADLTIANTNTQLSSVTGYMEKYAGHPLNKGRLTTALHYQVKGNEIKAENLIQIDQLTLGPRNNSPDATSLPVKLGVALLKDSNGRIELDVPINGRLDDPEFSIAPIVLKVVVNTLVKAATSPFKLLGALVGGGDELSFVQFEPGSTNLVDGELDKLTKLTSALAKRPALNLEIEGRIDPAADRMALARQKLENGFKAQRLKELSAKGRAPESAGSFVIEPEERARLLRVAFVQQFGTNVSEVIQANIARLTNQATNTVVAQPKPKRGVVGNVVHVVSLRAFRTPPSEKGLTKADRKALGTAPPEMMFELVAEKTPVTEEEFRQLMNDRARWVQDWLVQNGPVAADRLFIVAPKAAESGATGTSQVSLSLN